MSKIWNVSTYDSERRRLIPCFDDFYGTIGEMMVRYCPDAPQILDLGAGTGIVSETIAKRLPAAQFYLLDASADMLAQASKRLAGFSFQTGVQSLTEDLPEGPFHAVVSALAIHHLRDEDKRFLYERIFSVLAPGGIFLNAEQIAGHSAKLQTLFESVHLDQARALGSSEAEIAGAVERMRHDRCIPVSDQMKWLEEIGFEDVDCFYRSFRFAVFGGWKPVG